MNAPVSTLLLFLLSFAVVFTGANFLPIAAQRVFSAPVRLTDEAIAALAGADKALPPIVDETAWGRRDAMAGKTMPQTVRGIYLTASTLASAAWEPMIEKLIESQGNAVVLDIEVNGGQLAFEPHNEALRAINGGKAMGIDYAAVIETLHNKGLYVIARQVVFNDPFMAAKKPDWRIHYPGGALFDGRWLDASDAEVQAYNLAVLREAAHLGFDEVQLDYIRFPDTLENLDFDYDEGRYEKYEVIGHFLKKARRVSREEGVFLSVDVFGVAVWGQVDWRILGQSIAEMSRHVDAIYPMTYPSHFSDGFNGYRNFHNAPYTIVHDSIARFAEQAGGRSVIRTWVQGFPLKTTAFGTAYIAEQIRATLEAGGTGFVIWSPGNIYTYSWAALDIAL